MKVTTWYSFLKSKRLIIHVILSLISNGIVIYVPLVMGNFLNAVTSKSISLVFRNSYYYLSLVGILMITNYLLSINYTILGRRSEFKTKFFVYNKLYDIFDFKKYDDTQAGYLSSRIENDSNNMVNFLLKENVNFIFNILSILIILGILFNINRLLTFIIIVLVALNSIVYILFKKVIAKIAYELKDTNSIFFNQQNEYINILKSIKRNEWRRIFQSRLKEKFKDFYDISMSAAKINALYMNINMLIQNIISIIVMVICGYEIIYNRMNIGSFIVFNSYISRLMGIQSYFTSYGNIYQNAKVSSNRIAEIIKDLNDNPLNCSAKTEVLDSNVIEIKDLSFNFNKEPLITNLNYSFKKSNIYIISGDNGKGKSTFFDILMGIFTYDGDIFIDGVNLKNLDLQKFKENNVSIVEQDPTVINDTLYNNLVLNNSNINDKKLKFLLKEFCIKQDLNDIIQNNLSGGEKQKINIIRSLIKNSKLIMMDEPTTALDVKSRNTFYKIIPREKKGKIIIIITHDLELVKLGDNIIEF